jgi:CBS domain containing-hemolysin-like protein
MPMVRDANRSLHLELPENAGYKTMAGFLMAQAGRLLKNGDVIKYDGLAFQVELLDGRRIRRIRFTPKKPED